MRAASLGAQSDHDERLGDDPAGHLRTADPAVAECDRDLVTSLRPRRPVGHLDLKT
jgi:hypothetical protein